MERMFSAACCVLKMTFLDLKIVIFERKKASAIRLINIMEDTS